MSYDQTFRGALHFKNRSALKRALRELEEAAKDGDLEESAVARRDLKTDGLTLRVEVTGSFPASFWEVTCGLLEQLAAHAEDGSIEATYDGGDGPPLIERIAPPVPEELAGRAADLGAVVRSNDVKAVRALLDRGLSADELLREAATCKAAVVELLLSAGASANGSEAYRPLRWAAQYGSAEVVKTLLAAGADPDLLDGREPCRTTPLHMAAFHGHLSVVKLLLEHGAGILLVDSPGEDTPLHCAVDSASRSRLKIAELLVAAGAPAETRNVLGQTPLDRAKKRGAKDLVALLKKRRP